MAIYVGTIIATRFPADLTGYKIALYGAVTADEIEALGGVPLRIAASELYTALQVGVVDAVAANNSSDLTSLEQQLGSEFNYREYVSEAPVDVPTTGDDDLFGMSGRDSVHLLAGNDSYSGRDGNDRVWGDRGNDTLKGNAGRDKLWGGAGADKLFGGSGADILNGGTGRDLLLGGGGNDELIGGTGNDSLRGGAGNDLVNGGRGNDVMTGGKGADIFVFETYGEKNHDTITDFRKGVDTIKLFDGDYTIGKSGGNIVLRFGGGESLTLEGLSNRKGLAASIEAPKPTETPEPPTAESNPFIIFDLGGKYDKSFNEAAWTGAERWADATGDTYGEIELQSEAQREQALRRAAELDYGPVVALGSASASALEAVAGDYPDTPFAIIDAVVDQPNVSSFTFAEHEGAYLMGVMAAMASESHVVGFIGGMDIPLTHRYSTAFEQGVLAADPDAEVLVSMTGTVPSAWNDPVKGGELANAQIAQGADVIFAVAGGTGLGVLQAVANAGILGIGVDSNMNYLHPGSILTSMVKRVDVVVEDIFDQGVGIKPGIHELGFADGAISYALDEYNRDLITSAMARTAERVMDDIASGAIVVHDYYDDIMS